MGTHGKFDGLGRFADPSLLILTSLTGGPKHEGTLADRMNRAVRVSRWRWVASPLLTRNVQLAMARSGVHPWRVIP